MKNVCAYKVVSANKRSPVQFCGVWLNVRLLCFLAGENRRKTEQDGYKSCHRLHGSYKYSDVILFVYIYLEREK